MFDFFRLGQDVAGWQRRHWMPAMQPTVFFVKEKGGCSSFSETKKWQNYESFKEGWWFSRSSFAFPNYYLTL